MIPDQQYFDTLYETSDDPWNFSAEPYERRKYALTVAALPKQHYRRAFEPGCSVGELTALLAQRCRAVFAVDRAPRAIDLARGTLERTGVTNNVELRVADVRESIAQEAKGSFDLVVLSEILYYFPVATAVQIADSAARLVEPGGTLIAVHWRGHSPDHCCTGDEVHAAISQHAAHDSQRWALSLHTTVEDRGFLIQVWQRPPE